MEKLRNACWERFGNRPEVGTHHLMGNEARSPAPLLLQPAPPLRRVAKPRSAHYRRCCCANRSAGSIQGPWASKRLSNHQPDLHFCLQPHRSRNQQKSSPVLHRLGSPWLLSPLRHGHWGSVADTLQLQQALSSQASSALPFCTEADIPLVFPALFSLGE